MTRRLKLGAIPDDTPVKLVVELPAETHRMLQAYAEALKPQTEQAVAPAKLVPVMLQRFMMSDRGFARARGK